MINCIVYHCNKLETFTEIKALNYYTVKFRRLRVDRAHGIAPHKPILLLSIIELIKSDLLKKNQIYLSVELIETFLHIWSYLGSESHNPDISKPFFHLKGDKFWHLIPNEGFREILNSKVKIKTFAEVKQAIKYAYIDDTLFELLQIPNSRENLTYILLNKWFYSKLNQYEELQNNICR